MQDRLTKTKRAVLLIVLAFSVLATVGAVVVDMGSPQARPAVEVTLALFSILALVLLLMLWRRPARLQTTLAIYVCSLAIQMLFLFASALFADDTPDAERFSHIRGAFPFVFILLFITFPVRTATAASALYALVNVCILAICIAQGPSNLSFWVQTMVTQLILAHGSYICLLYVFARIKEEHGSSETRANLMQELASTDELTRLMNRRGMEAVLADVLDSMQNAGQRAAVILCDLDEFKAVNDRHGHPTGDIVLREFSDVLRQSMRTSNYAARWGGEEFMCVLPDCSEDNAKAVAERIRTQVAAHTFPTVGSITVSFGVAAITAEDTLATLLERVDAALYCAKAEGRNRVCVAPATGAC